MATRKKGKRKESTGKPETAAKGTQPAPEPEAAPEPTPEAEPAAAPPAEAEGLPRDFHVVGLGASAGGLDALEAFFQNVPERSGISFVVVTHQHPGHVSLLPELIAKRTAIPVEPITEGALLLPDRVLVTPPGYNVHVRHGRLHLTRIEHGHLPIDHFFRSMAEELDGRAVCIVLSGTGTDGTLGLREIKAQGGMAMVQDDVSARYSGMPLSAADTGLADYVLPPEKMAESLLAYVRASTASFGADRLTDISGVRQRIFGLLRARTGQDFSGYKPSTIRRRIERRMRVHQLEQPPDYLHLLESNPHELDLLFKELLISVTSFFRDPDAFAELARRIEARVGELPDDYTFRVWVPGCATGEEAYSLAILLQEVLERLKRPLLTQIFATDLDERAILKARAGSYPEGITADVNAERLARFFARNAGGYRVSKSVREMIVFAVQNVLKDPPFTRLDLVSCRNLLIYLNPDIQHRLLPVLHYALKPGGILMLGTSETVGELEDVFEPLDRKWRLYERLPGPPGAGPVGGFNLESLGAQRVARRGAPAASPSAAIEKALLERFAPPTAIISERGDIAYLHGRTGNFLEPSSGEPQNNLFAMAREGLEYELPSLVRIASDQGREVTHRGIPVRTNGDFAQVDLVASPILEPESIRGLIRVSFEIGEKPAVEKKTRRGGRAKELELELQHTRETLQSTIEEQQSTNEELQSANEELQSTNEELQSANEELETSREELQSLNEELQTVNSELMLKNEELAHANDDMQNLLQSTDIATLFLDTELRIKRFTSQAREVINLIPSDRGRPVGDLSINIRYDGLAQDAQRVLDTLVPHEVEVQTTDGEWRVIRTLPYRTSQNVIDGVVITVIDIDRIKRAEALASSRAFAESIVQTVREPLVVIDPDLAVVTANRAFFQSFGFDPDQVQGRRLVDLPGGEFWALPEFRTLLDAVVKEGQVFEDFEVQHELPGVGARHLLLNARRLEPGSGKTVHVLLALEVQDATISR